VNKLVKKLKVGQLAPRTLRGRLLAVATGSILGAVLLSAIAAVALVNHELRGTLDTALRQRAQAVAQLAVSAPAVLTDPGALESPVSGRAFAVQVVDRHGRILSRSLALGAPLLPVDQLARRALVGGHTGFEDITIAGNPFRVYAAPVADAGGRAAGGAVLVASETADIRHTVHHLGFVIALSGAIAAFLAALLAAWLTRKGTEPLARLAAAGREIERTADPARRLPDSGSDDEVGQLTGVLNRMLASLEEARASERRFLADASHELRTPVTALLGNVEYAARHGADPDVLEDLRRDAARLARLVDDLLVLERVGDRPPDHELEPIALDSLVAAVVAERGDGSGRVELGSLAEVRARADPDALSRALSNLIDNALVHGPADGRVVVALSADDGHARVTVTDEGPGPDAADRQHLFERFWRGAGASERPGSGLGLSIVAAIAERHGGTVAVEGAVFAIELPAVR
jgi:two-component system OmpR family sensor kinase